MADQADASAAGPSGASKKKRNPSLRRKLREAGIEVPPLPPPAPKVSKRKRSRRRPVRHRASKRRLVTKSAEALGRNEKAAFFPPASSTSSHPDSLEAVLQPPLPSEDSCSGCINSRDSRQIEEGDLKILDVNVPEWHSIDPLGLFDDLEGPLDWPSRGLFNRCILEILE